MQVIWHNDNVPCYIYHVVDMASISIHYGLPGAQRYAQLLSSSLGNPGCKLENGGFGLQVTYCCV